MIVRAASHCIFSFCNTKDTSNKNKIDTMCNTTKDMLLILLIIHDTSLEYNSYTAFHTLFVCFVFRLHTYVQTVPSYMYYCQGCI